MNVGEFKESNSTIGHGDEKFDVHLDGGEEGGVVICWKLDMWERVWVLFTGRVWQHNLTYGHDLQTCGVSIEKPRMGKK